MIKYTEYRVPVSLAALVKKLWTLDNLSSPAPVENRSVLPNGCFNIAFIAGEGVLISNKTGKIKLSKGVYFCGQMTELLHIDIHSHSRATMIQLHPWTPVHFDQAADMSKYTDRFISLDQLGNYSLTHLLDSAEATICRAVAAIFGPLFNADKRTLLLASAAQAIMDSHGDLNVTELSIALNCSHRYLQKLFKKHIGLSPKRFSNIIKLRDTVDELAYPENGPGTLTTLAITNGFYDQAHFNNSFQSIVKTSPHKFSIDNCFLSFKK
jgi:AraC-like DNA-binding protein